MQNYITNVCLVVPVMLDAVMGQDAVFHLFQHSTLNCTCGYCVTAAGKCTCDDG